MKHKIITLCVLCFVVLSISITAFATISSDVGKEHPCLSLSEQIDEIQSVFSSLSDDPAYGGIYYEGDTLIVNVVADQPVAYHQTQSFRSTYPDIDIQYHEVKYSLGFLESVKDYLTPKMNSWDISVLDANEMTNQVDVCLRNYNNQVQSDITQFINESFGSSDFLNFIDYSNLSIQDTVADFSDECPPFTNTVDNDLSPASIGLFSNGEMIVIGSSGYTLGPALSFTSAYTAGHGYSGQKPVYGGPNLDMLLGTVTGHYGGSNGD